MTVLATLAPGFGGTSGIVGEIATTGTPTLAPGLGGAVAIIGEVAWVAALVSPEDFSPLR